MQPTERHEPTTCGTCVELALVLVISTAIMFGRWLRERLGL